MNFILDECFKYKTDFYGDDLSGGFRSGVASAEKCQKICQVNEKVCLKSNGPESEKKAG